MPTHARLKPRSPLAARVALALSLWVAACAAPEARVADGRGDDVLTLGAAEPLVEVTVFCDYQCPECRRTERVLAPLLTHFEGDLAIRYRSFPLSSVHPLARDAAVYALAADRQGGFACLHRLLVARQESWTDDTPAELRQRVGGYLGACGLDVARFDADVDDPALARIVDADTALARELEAPGTPTVYVHGLTPARWPKPGVAARDLLLPTVRRELEAARRLLARGAARRDVPRLLTERRGGPELAGQLHGAP
jgi:predicted DsbA family dithiol-disulfide isomerase